MWEGCWPHVCVYTVLHALLQCNCYSFHLEVRSMFPPLNSGQGLVTAFTNEIHIIKRM